MTAPKHAIEIKGKGRYYANCGADHCPFGDRQFISVTNAQDVIAKPALVPAAAKETATAAWNLLPLMVATSRQPEAGKPADGGKSCQGRRFAARQPAAGVLLERVSPPAATTPEEAPFCSAARRAEGWRCAAACASAECADDVAARVSPPGSEGVR